MITKPNRAVNNRTQTIDRNGRTTKYGYDNLNRIQSEAWANGGKTFTYTYDQNGNRLTANDGSIAKRCLGRSSMTTNTTKPT